MITTTWENEWISIYVEAAYSLLASSAVSSYFQEHFWNEMFVFTLSDVHWMYSNQIWTHELTNTPDKGDNFNTYVNNTIFGTCTSVTRYLQVTQIYSHSSACFLISLNENAKPYVRHLLYDVISLWVDTLKVVQQYRGTFLFHYCFSCSAHRLVLALNTRDFTDFCRGLIVEQAFFSLVP